MARNFAAMVMSSAKPVGSAGMKLPSQIIKEQQNKKGGAAPAPDTHAAEKKAAEEKAIREKEERDKKDKADKELKAKADAPRKLSTPTQPTKAAAATSASPAKAMSGQFPAADKARKEREEKEKREKAEKEKAEKDKKEKDEREKKAKAEKEKKEKEDKEKAEKAKRDEEAKKKAAEAAKRPASFERGKSPSAERAGSPIKAATTIAPIKEEPRGKSPVKEEPRTKSPDKKEEKVHETAHAVETHTEAPAAASGGGHCKLEKDRWYVEGYDGATHADPIIVKVDSPKESVYVGKCHNGVVVQVEGKCKSLQVNSCVDVGLVCETVVATVEIMNSQKCQVQTTGTVNLIQLDNCERCKLFLSKDALEADCKVFTAKSSNTLVYSPTDDGEDMLEMSLPEQFISSMNSEGNAIRHEIVMPEAVLS